MSRHRAVAAALACLLLTGSELEQARDEVSEAERRLQGAQSDATRASLTRASVDASLAAVTANFETTAQRAEELGLLAAGLAVDLEQTEESLRRVSRLAGQQVVAAYIAGVAGLGEAAFAAGSLEQALIVNEAVDSLRRDRLAAVVNLHRRRIDLRALRAEHQNALAGYQREQERLLVLKDDLADVLALADVAVGEAYRNLASAESAYDGALTRLEKEKRRAAALRGVEYWRSLVARYFPSQLVDEALVVMHCESRGDPDALHPRSGASGLFQFMEGTWAWVSVRAGLVGASRFDPEANVAGAAWLVGHSLRTAHPQGAWGRWTCRP